MRKKTLFILVGALLTLPGITMAAPAISCHCFQNREFDTSQPGAADAYLLATTYNSFQAMALGLDKKTIVRGKMSGQASEDLWLAHWLAKETGQPVDKVRQMYSDAGSWLALAQDSARAGIKSLSMPKDISSDKQLAQAVARSEMTRTFDVEAAVLSGLQKKGASLKEMTLSLFLSSITGDPAGEIFDKVHAGEMTWDLVAQRADIDFSTIETKLKELTTEHRP